MKNPFIPELLAGKSALVTGASQGIGKQCVLSLAAAGAEVTAVARNENKLRELQEQSQWPIHIWAIDATSTEFLKLLPTKLPVDILVNNLGTNQPEPFVDIQEETLLKVMDMNVNSLIRTTQLVVSSLLSQKRAGSIVNISSQMGHVGSPNRTLYCTTKHAIEGLTKALAVELAPQQIRVNAVAPTFIETPLVAPMLEDSTFRQFALERIPMGKIGSVDDVANAVVYLASDASALVTGTSLKVDGGWTAQ